MNIQHIQINRQKVAALLLAGSILAASLAWAGADAGDSTFQPAPMAQDCAYSLEPGQTGPSAAEVVCPGADFRGGESGLLPWSQLRSIKGSKPVASAGSN